MPDEADRTLVFLWMIGCDACAEAKPHVKRFEEEHEIDVKYIEMSALGEAVDDVGIALTEEIRMLPPNSIPAYIVLYHDGTKPRTLSSRGALTFDQLTSWVFAL